jgi:hypothetical protein
MSEARMHEAKGNHSLAWRIETYLCGVYWAEF